MTGAWRVAYVRDPIALDRPPFLPSPFRPLSLSDAQIDFWPSLYFSLRESYITKERAGASGHAGIARV